MCKQTIILIFLLLISFVGFAQNNVSGTIKDIDGEPISFVAIAIIGTNSGEYSDDNGNFSINYNGDPQTSMLRFSFTGYATQEISINGRKNVDIILLEDAQLLEEIVVVGYGVQKKSDITGSVSIINVDEAKLVPTTNVAELLRGKSAGVQVTLTDPSPGGKSDILIRGQNSLEGGNDPLFIVDGVPMESINSINSEDVESIEVLKDASAQAIYGARASNGVILITTKRGTTEGLKVSYHGYRSEQQLVRNFDLYTGEEWIKLRREAYRTDNNIIAEDGYKAYQPDIIVFPEELQREIVQEGKFVDWEDEAINNAVQQNHALSLSTGTEKSSLYASFSAFDQNGILGGTGYQRATARINIDHKINDRFSFGSNIYLVTDQKDEKSKNLNYHTITPVARVRDNEGNILRFASGGDKNVSPLWNIRESTNEYFTNTYQFTFFAEYEIFKNFKYKLNSFISRNNGQGGTYFSSTHSNGVNDKGNATLKNHAREEYLVENIFSYDLKINSSNNLDFTFVQSASERGFIETEAAGTNFPNDILGYNGIESASNVLPVKRKAWKRRMLSLMGRARYSLADKYLLTLTARRDGSSVFARENKYGFFPSVSLGWKAHLEPFIQKLNVINELKFRTSYGSIGNEAIDPYKTLGLANSENYISDGIVIGGYAPGAELFNPFLKWEESTTFNFGVDFGLFNNFFVGNFEIYDARTTDLLIKRSTPGGTGYSTIISNIGETQNSGIELGVTANIIQKKNFDFSLISTFSKNKNKIIKLNDDVDADGNPIDDVANARFIGYPINVIHLHQADGIWGINDDIANSHMPDAKPGEIRLKDINGDGKIDNEDKVIIKKAPDWYGALGAKIKIGGFNIFAEIYHVKGATKVNPFLAAGSPFQGVSNGIKVDYWTPENQTGTAPRPSRNAWPSNTWAYAVRDASYTRLRTISVSYNLPTTLMKKMKLSNISIYGTVSNLITWTDYQSYSPEGNADQYPDGKQFLFGIKIQN